MVAPEQQRARLMLLFLLHHLPLRGPPDPPPPMNDDAQLQLDDGADDDMHAPTDAPSSRTSPISAAGNHPEGFDDDRRRRRRRRRRRSAGDPASSSDLRPCYRPGFGVDQSPPVSSSQKTPPPARGRCCSPGSPPPPALLGLLNLKPTVPPPSKKSPPSAASSSSSSSSSLGLSHRQQQQQQGGGGGHLFPPNIGYRLGQRKILFERRKRVSDYALVCALVGVVGMVFETEMTMAYVYDKNSLCSFAVKTIISLTTVLLLLLIIVYHGLQAKLFVVENCVGDWRIAISWSALGQLAVELVVCSIHPVPTPTAHHFTWTTLHADGETVTVARVPVDLALSLPMFLRFYLVGRVVLLRSRLFSDATSRSIGALNRINFNTRFILKTLMTICPGSVLVLFMLSLWILASWTLRACEGCHELKHRNLLNSLWMVAITFLSVGYGDIVPNTYCGRAVAVGTGIMGSGCTALVVAVLARKLELTRAEKHVHNFMMDNQLTKTLKNAAANVLRETWLIYKNTKLVKKVKPGQIRSHQRRFLHAIRSLRNVKLDQRKLNDSANTLVDVAKHFIHSALDPTQTAYISQPPAIYRQTQLSLFEMLVEMNDKQRSVEGRADRIEEQLKSLQDRLDDLPQLIADALTVNNS